MEKTFSSSISQTVFQREKVTTEVAEAHSGSNCIFTKSRLPIFLRTIKWSLDVERLLFLWPSQCRNSSTTILTTPYSCRRVRSILPGNFLAPHIINIAQRARKQAATKLPQSCPFSPIPFLSRCLRNRLVKFCKMMTISPLRQMVLVPNRGVESRATAFL